MLNKTKFISITLCAAGLTACNTFNSNTNQPELHPAKAHAASIQLYPDGYDNGGAYAPNPAETKTMMLDGTDAASTIPNAMGSSTVNTGAAATGSYQAPVSFKDRDNNWVSKQNPQGYTIEVANGEKAADVASTLNKTPRNERMAEVKYKQDGKEHYAGLYGSYPSYEAAQKALSTLPEDVRQNAGIKTWGNVQSTVNE